MQVRILGPLEVRGDSDEVISVAGARLRVLLTRLALAAGRPVSVATLVDAVWGEHPPADEANALQTLISRLRRALGAASTIGQSSSGYRLAITRADVDAFRFEHLAAQGASALRAGQAHEAARILREALGLWRGPALLDAGESVAADAARLQDLRLSALLDRIDADLALGRASTVVAEVEARAGEYPLHERLAGQLVRALAASGRQADALATYERVRARLADELGVDPSAELQQIHLAVLRGELSPVSPDTARPRTNLRAQLTSFVGRDDEVARIGKSLEENRLVTLVGPGGAGKTRLASEAAAAIVNAGPSSDGGPSVDDGRVGTIAADGVWLVELAPVTDAADLPQTVLGSLGIREAHLLDRRSRLTARDAMSRLLETLADKRTVLILDNCEHVIEAGARLADDLLARCATLRILATSREPLSIVGETLLVVPPLGHPPADADAAEALQYPAVRLFVDRSGAVAPDFTIDDSSISTVIDIVRRLDGLPLAIELAAARMRTLPLAEIATRLSDRFGLLTGGSRTAMPRHRTLRAVVEWSWELLTPPERLLAERLSVFPAGATTVTARAVCADERVPSADVADLLGSLVDKSLLQRADAGGRVRMLETIREYGLERLHERGGEELRELRSRHARYFADLLTEAQPHLTSADQLPWFALLTAERDNIMAASRFRSESGDPDGALEIAVALAGFAMLLGNHSEVPSLVGEALLAPGGSDSQARHLAEALYTMNALMGTPGADGGEGGPDKKTISDVCANLDQVDLDWHPLVGLLQVGVAFLSGDTDRAERYVQQALAGGNAWTGASVLMMRASLAENRGDVESMRADTTTALAEFRRLGERWGTASTLRSAALLHTLDGDLDAAEAAYAEAMALMAEMHSSDDEGFMRVRIADLRLRRGDIPGAREQLRLARQSAEGRGSVVETVFALSTTAVLEQQAGNLELARRLHAECERRVATLPRDHPIYGHCRTLSMVFTTVFATNEGDLDTARRCVKEAYAAGVETGDLPMIATVGVGLAALLAREGRPDQAAQALGSAAALRGAEDPTHVDIARITVELTQTLGPERFQNAYGRGRVLDSAAALAFLDPAGR